MRFLLVLGILFIYGCTNIPISTNITYQQLKIQSEIDENPKWLMPYKSIMDSIMGQKLMKTEKGLTKGLPVSDMGVFLTDLLLHGDSLDAKVLLMNEGGIRSSFVSGNVNLGNLFEVLPFDNKLVLLEMDSMKFISFLDVFAKKGGTPVSGIQWQISNKKTSSVVFSKPLKNHLVRVWVNDYLANGGDYCTMLVGLPWIAEGPLLRDAVQERIKKTIPSDSILHVSRDERILVR
jgi:2',3'-cyclic-nucleotide 2'-phosphodiesterase (5'-nucleotidase family)